MSINKRTIYFFLKTFRIHVILKETGDRNKKNFTQKTTLVSAPVLPTAGLLILSCGGYDTDYSLHIKLITTCFLPLTSWGVVPLLA